MTFRHTGSRRRSGVSLARDSIAHGNTNVPSRYAQLSILPFSTPFVDFNPLPQTTNGKLSLLLSPRISINRKIVDNCDEYTWLIATESLSGDRVSED